MSRTFTSRKLLAQTQTRPYLTCESTMRRLRLSLPTKTTSVQPQRSVRGVETCRNGCSRWSTRADCTTTKFLKVGVRGREMLSPYPDAFADPSTAANIISTPMDGIHALRLSWPSGLRNTPEWRAILWLSSVRSRKTGRRCCSGESSPLSVPLCAFFRRALDLYCGLPPIDLDSANKSCWLSILQPAESMKSQSRLAIQVKNSHCRSTHTAAHSKANIICPSKLRWSRAAWSCRPWHLVGGRDALATTTFFVPGCEQRRLAEEQDWYPALR